MWELHVPIKTKIVGTIFSAWRQAVISQLQLFFKSFHSSIWKIYKLLVPYKEMYRNIAYCNEVNLLLLEASLVNRLDMFTLYD